MAKDGQRGHFSFLLPLESAHTSSDFDKVVLIQSRLSITFDLTTYCRHFPKREIPYKFTHIWNTKYKEKGNNYKTLLRDSKRHKNKHTFTEQSSGCQGLAVKEAHRMVKEKPSFWCWSVLWHARIEIYFYANKTGTIVTQRYPRKRST